jgi:DNA polymerase III alpha subunit/very-short-patch-repair endonuclease
MEISTYVPLRNHSAYSLLEGAIKIPALVKIALAEGFAAVAITDSHNMFGSLEFSEACCKAGVQPIIGCVFRLMPMQEAAGASEYDELLLLAKDEIGYAHLMKLVSDSYLHPEHVNMPLISLASLAKYNEGLIALSGGVQGAIGKAILRGKIDTAYEFAKELGGVFAGRFYVEIMRHGLPEEAQTEPHFLQIAKELNLPIIATNDAYFYGEEMYEAHDALICIAEGRYVVEDNRRRLTPEHRLKSHAEICALFADLPEALENTHIVASRCAVRSPSRKPMLPSYHMEENGVVLSEAEALRKAAREGLDKRLEVIFATPHASAAGKALASAALTREESNPSQSQDISSGKLPPPLRGRAGVGGALTNSNLNIAKPYYDRLEYELDVIINMGFPGYFLIVSDFITWSKQQGIPVGPGRGSGAASVVAWSLLITDLDPLAHDLVFERFLNPERVSMPDFDIDFCQERRDEVINYVQSKYGADRVAQIITFGKLQARAVLRDVGRVLQMPYGQVDRICKLVPNNPANPVTLAQAIELEPLLKAQMEEEEAVAKLVDISLKLEGLYRHASTHAAGVVIADRPLNQLVPLYSDGKSSMPVVQYSMKYAEEAGLVKFDFLGLKTLSVLKKAVDMVNAGNNNLTPHGSTSGVALVSPALPQGESNSSQPQIHEIENSSPPLAGGGRGRGEGEIIIANRQHYPLHIKQFARDMRKNPTQAEAKLWQLLQNKNTGYKFRRQHNIDGCYIADFVCLEQRLIIKIDGGQHSENEDDKMRTSYFEAQNFRIMRFWNNEILQNTEGCYELILQELQNITTPHASAAGKALASAALPQGESNLSQHKDSSLGDYSPLAGESMRAKTEWVGGKDKTLQLEYLPINDEPTYELLRAGNGVGVFQFESVGMRETLKKLRPDRLEDLIALGALYRPGPMDNIPTYIACKHGKEQPNYLHPSLEGVLKETYGVIIYQEQVQKIAQILSGYTLGSADLLRRAMGKKIKAEMDAQRKIFVDGAKNNNVPSNQANEIFDLVAKFAGYGFNKAHAAAYGLIGYQTAYLKANYPYEFIAASMSYDMHNTDKLNLFKQDAASMNIRILPPDINTSEADFTVQIDAQGKYIRYALSALKNVGEQAMQDLVKERKKGGNFASIYDVMQRLDTKIINKRSLENLVMAGAFDSIHSNRAQLFASIEMMINYGQQQAEERNSAQISLFGEDTGGAIPPPELAPTPDWEAVERLGREYQAVGFYLSAHPLDGYSFALKQMRVKAAEELPELLGEQYRKLTMAGIVMGRKFKNSQRGRFAFVQLSDATGVYEATIYDEKLMDSCRPLLELGKMLLLEVEGKSGEDGGVRIIIQSMIPLEDALKAKSTSTSINNVTLVINQPEAVLRLKEMLPSPTNAGAKIQLRIPLDANRHALMNLSANYNLNHEMIVQLSQINGISLWQE